MLVSLEFCCLTFSCVDYIGCLYVLWLLSVFVVCRTLVTLVVAFAANWLFIFVVFALFVIVDCGVVVCCGIVDVFSFALGLCLVYNLDLLLLICCELFVIAC